MPVYTVPDLIERAMNQGDLKTNFITRNDWLNYLNSEYRHLYVRLARANYPINLNSYQITANGALTYSITNITSTGIPLAIIAIYKLDTNNSLVKLRYYSYINRRQNAATSTGDATEFTVVPSEGSLVLTFNPSPTSGTYIVDCIPHPPKLVYSGPAAGEVISITLPVNWEERLVLGSIRRAYIKEETVNYALEQLIKEVDENIDNSVQDWIFEQNNVVHRVQDRFTGGFIFI